MAEIRLNLAERSYSILIGPGLLAITGRLLRERQFEGRVLVVTNHTVGQWYLEPLVTTLTEVGFDVKWIEIPAGEYYKSLEQASAVYDTLVAGKYNSKSLLIALGGGVIGDLTGFVAATYMRGIRFIQIPTTLLAQVDASIGGKVAVNHPKGKNLIGAFYQPRLVISDVTTLKSLPEPEFGAGMAEVIKHGLILDENYFWLIANKIQEIDHLDPSLLSEIVSGSCRIKAKIVEEDEQESGKRIILNFGHTVGHALESVTNYSYYKHGEAVALGMLAATLISGKVGLLVQNDLVQTLREIYQPLKLPQTLLSLAVKDILSAMAMDKKAEASKIRWVLPVKIGEAVISNEVSAAIVAEALIQMGGKS